MRTLDREEVSRLAPVESIDDLSFSKVRTVLEIKEVERFCTGLCGRRRVKLFLRS